MRLLNQGDEKWGENSLQINKTLWNLVGIARANRESIKTLLKGETRGFGEDE